MKHGQERQRDQGSFARRVGGDVGSTIEIKEHFTTDDVLRRTGLGRVWTLDHGLSDANALHRGNDPTERFFNPSELLIVSQLDRGESNGGVGAVLRDLRPRLIAVRGCCNALGVELVESCRPEERAQIRLANIVSAYRRRVSTRTQSSTAQQFRSGS